MKLIDTDVLIDHFHGNKFALAFLDQTIASGESLAISVVTLVELKAGIRPGEEETTNRLLSLFHIIPITEEIGHKAGEYLRLFHKTNGVELGDALIAATSYIDNCELITRNQKHYPMEEIKVTIPYNRR